MKVGKKMKKPLLFLIILSLLLAVGCSSKQTGKEHDAKQVVTNFFKWYSEKNLDKMESLMLKQRKGIVWQLDKLEYVKLLKIEVDTAERSKKNYLTTGGGSLLKPYDVVIFNTEFDIKFNGGFAAGMDDGKYGWNYIVVKEKENSPWLIADWGM